MSARTAGRLMIVVSVLFLLFQAGVFVSTGDMPVGLITSGVMILIYGVLIVRSNDESQP